MGVTCNIHEYDLYQCLAQPLHASSGRHWITRSIGRPRLSRPVPFAMALSVASAVRPSCPHKFCCEPWAHVGRSAERPVLALGRRLVAMLSPLAYHR